ncbi:hypothetical protein [Ralstonia solanacearum]|uniref:hypothetical protein n=1 Tax=Ralstonia solanacearum TaxID=305 RepID=UPI003CC53949
MAIRVRSNSNVLGEGDAIRGVSEADGRAYWQILEVDSSSQDKLRAQEQGPKGIHVMKGTFMDASAFCWLEGVQQRG